MDHVQLLQELPTVNRLTIPQRVVLARQKRSTQLTNYFSWTTVPDEEVRGRRKRVKFTPEVELLEACDEGRCDEVEQLLDKGNDPNVAIDGITALHRSCINGTEKILRLLLDRGADVNCTDPDGWTPLHVAATCGHTTIAEILVECGADLIAANEDKELPFEIAEHAPTRQYLENQMLRKGVRQRQIDIIHNEVQAMLHKHTEYAIENGVSLDLPVTAEGATLLHVAVQQGCNKIVRRLIAKDASPYVTDNEGWMAAHVAAYCNNKKALEILATETDFNFDTTNAANETLCDLCDQGETRNYIRHVQRERMRLALLASVNLSNPLKIISSFSPDKDQTHSEETDSKSEIDDDKSAMIVELARSSPSSSSDESDDDFSYVYYVNYPAGRDNIERETTNKNSLRKVKKNYPALGQALFVKEAKPNNNTESTSENPPYKVSYLSDSMSSAASSVSEESGGTNTYAVNEDATHNDDGGTETYRRNLSDEDECLQVAKTSTADSTHSENEKRPENLLDNSGIFMDSNRTIVDDEEMNNIRQIEFDSANFRSLEIDQIDYNEGSTISNVNETKQDKQLVEHNLEAMISHHSESIISDNFEVVNSDKSDLVDTKNVDIDNFLEGESSASSNFEFEAINHLNSRSVKASISKNKSDSYQSPTSDIEKAPQNELHVTDNINNVMGEETIKPPAIEVYIAQETVSLRRSSKNSSLVDNDSSYSGVKTNDSSSSTDINTRIVTNSRRSLDDSVYRADHAPLSLHELKKRRSQYRDVSDLSNEIHLRTEDRFDVPMVAGHFRYSLKQIAEEAGSKPVSLISTKKKCSIM